LLIRTLSHIQQRDQQQRPPFFKFDAHNPPGVPTPSTEGAKLLNTKKKLRATPRQLPYSAVKKMRNANLAQVTPFTGKAFLGQATLETAYLLQSTRPPRLRFLFSRLVLACTSFGTAACALPLR